MEFQEIKELIRLIDQSSLRSFSLSDQGAVIQMSKNEGALPAQSAAPMAAAAASPAEAIAFSAPSPAGEAPSIKEVDPVNGNTITAPLVGTFYASAAPDKPPFVTVGSQVKEGDVVCIIEAMKVMNEVISPYNGTVQKILVENEEVVGYGQPLFLIR